jgi:hypothetical protein
MSDRLQYHINSDELKTAHQLAKLFSKRKEWAGTQYGEGLLNSDKDPYRTEFVGVCGEIAFSKIFGVPMDENYKPKGNDYDFLKMLGNKVLKIDVKTNSKRYRNVFIRATNNYGKIQDLKSDIYVFAHLENETKESVDVVILGFVTKIYMQKNSIGHELPALKGVHKNYYFEYYTLFDTDNLVWLLNVK